MPHGSVNDITQQVQMVVGAARAATVQLQSTLASIERDLRVWQAAARDRADRERLARVRRSIDSIRD